MVRQGASNTLAGHYYEQLRHEILEGRLPPGLHLQPASLATRIGTSTTVVRDILLRLVGERLCVRVPGKGFFVPSLELAELADLTLVRVHSDTLGLRLAMERGDLSWESSVVAAQHALSRTARRDQNDPGHTTDEWSRAHKRFHLALIGGCGVPMLIDLCSTLFDSTELYRRWAAPSPGATERDVAAEHALLAEATLVRDAARAGEALRQHYTKTLDVILTSGLVKLPTVADDADSTRASGTPV